MQEVSTVIESARLARALSNTLAFVPAKCIFPWIRLTVAEDEITTTGGDLYAFGTDSAPAVKTPECPFPALEAILTRSDAIELERLARADKKGEGTLRTVGPGPTGDWLFTFRPQNAELDLGSYIAWGMGDLKAGPEESPFIPSNLFGQVDELLDTLLDAQSWKTAQPLAFTPAILSRFAKVKRHDDSPEIMDCWISSPDEPILVKIGPAFTGAIMPVVRKAYVEANPEAEGVWAG